MCAAATTWLRRVRGFRAPGMGVPRLAGCDPLARKRPAQQTRRADRDGGASAATRRSERRAAAGSGVPWIDGLPLSFTSIFLFSWFLFEAFLKSFLGRLRTKALPLQVVQIRDRRLTAAFRGAARSRDSGPSASGLGLNSHAASSAVHTARCVLGRRIACTVAKTHSRMVVAGTLQQLQQHHYDDLLLVSTTGELCKLPALS